MKIIKKALKILEQPVCDHCLGRQFAKLLTGTHNQARGRALRTVIAMDFDSQDQNIDKSNFHSFKFHHREEEAQKKECAICKGFFNSLNQWSKKILNKARDIEFKTFLIGTKLPYELIKTEETLWERVGIDYCEPLKAEINRELGKIIEKKTSAVCDLKRPHVNFILDLKKQEIITKINSLFIYGEYQKLKRGIPQTKWPSEKYKTSVEEIITKPVIEKTNGTGQKFHGQGREDIDARCLDWRSFILEILEPKKREIDLKKITTPKRKVKIRKLKFVKHTKVPELKQKNTQKTYKINIHTKKRITKKDLNKLESLKNSIIKQKTPTRVLHRRSDRTRKRKVIDIKTEYNNSQNFDLIVRTEPGLYIKELVTSDNGRTRPSISSIVGCKCTYNDLDVVKIHKKQF